MAESTELTRLKLKLNITDTAQDALLSELLEEAKEEILNWRYGLTSSIPTELPSCFTGVQIDAALVGYNLMGGENEIIHNENGINRTFDCTSMRDYIHKQVVHFVGL